MAEDVQSLEHDWKLLDHYQRFSTEMLRISLAGGAVIGFIISLPGWAERSSFVAVYLWIALACLGLSACASLGHLYVSSDSMWHLVSLRRAEEAIDKGETDSPGLEREVAAFSAEMKRQLKLSYCILIVDSLLLSIGAMVLFISFALML